MRSTILIDGKLKELGKPKSKTGDNLYMIEDKEVYVLAERKVVGRSKSCLPWMLAPKNELLW